ncbi:MAG: signal peptide peptidase SppA [Halieaceae bacterium]|jgi:protease-4|nr:signal peptide peptidase SppA [Halieaceae bacterium]
MIRRLFRGLWRSITVVRSSLANLFFLALVALLLIALLDRPAPLPERAALRLDLSGRVVDAPTRVGGSVLGFDDGATRELLLTDLIDSIDLAAKDTRIVALVIELDGLLGIGQSKITELREAIARFRKTGKPVVATADYYSQDQYLLAVEADTVLMHPYGAVAIEGYGYFLNFFAEALEKLSVSMHVFRAGEFKSVAEPFLRSEMSAGEREISRRWLGDLWDAYRSAVETRRGLPEGALDALLGAYAERLRAVGGDPAKLAAREGLVDELLDRQQRDAYLKALVGVESDEGSYENIDFASYLARQKAPALRPGEDSIAVVVAQGNIQPGSQGLGAIGAESLVETLRRAVDREGLRGLVLRINSGGGSVFASEIIRAELERIREEEDIPVVVSMGSVAASGGYYIATAADRILATPATITGSIGVFLAFPTFERLLERGGVYTDGVGTTPVAGGARLDRPLSPIVEDALQQTVEDIYQKFLDLVARSRDLRPDVLGDVAEGRVLSALQAREVGLVDGLGSLDDAAAAAAELAGLDADSYRVITIKPSISPQQLLLQRLSDLLLRGPAPVSELGLWVRSHFPALAPAAVVLGPAYDELTRIMEHPDPRHLYMRCLSCESLAF